MPIGPEDRQVVTICTYATTSVLINIHLLDSGALAAVSDCERIHAHTKREVRDKVADMGEEQDDELDREEIPGEKRKLRDSSGSVGEGRKRTRVAPEDQVKGPVGSISRIRLQNFMCHDQFEW